MLNNDSYWEYAKTCTNGGGEAPLLAKNVKGRTELGYGPIPDHATSQPRYYGDPEEALRAAIHCINNLKSNLERRY